MGRASQACREGAFRNIFNLCRDLSQVEMLTSLLVSLLCCNMVYCQLQGLFGLGGGGGLGGSLSSIFNQGMGGPNGPLLSSLASGNLNPALLATMLGGPAIQDQGLNVDDLDNDMIPDHLAATKNRIDDYLAKTYKLGKRKLAINVNYMNMPLEHQYLSQFHGFDNPLMGTPLGPKYGLPGPSYMGGLGSGHSGYNGLGGLGGHAGQGHV